LAKITYAAPRLYRVCTVSPRCVIGSLAAHDVVRPVRADASCAGPRGGCLAPNASTRAGRRKVSRLCDRTAPRDHARSPPIRATAPAAARVIAFLAKRSRR
jgi:hypothetical protein